LAAEHGARVLEIEPGEFNHGGTRNLLVGEASGEHVALLTQDAEPADQDWLRSLLDGFALATDVGIVYGPYTPRPDAQFAVASELRRWFDSLAPDGEPAVERMTETERSGVNPLELLGRRGFFTDADACLLRSAWQRVPFRTVSFAEDRLLALDMMRAGYAKAYVPAAAVLHSHDLGPLEQVRRSFDESRALRELFGWREPASPARALSQLRGELGHARRELEAQQITALSRVARLAAVSQHHLARLIGAQLGSRAGTLPPRLRRYLSSERRAGFEPVDLDATPPPPSGAERSA
ncbi:MAG TPA: glycosyltransferase family 2 protein, partial [Solirubrobacteraceae bacterium]|nr:glycosyltransferase family 2 protein [Solirubrobacteraceae bacterium]